MRDVNVFVSRVVVSANTGPREKISRESYELCLQLSHDRSLYYGKIGSRVAQLWNCCLQPEPPYVLLTLFPRLCQSVAINAADHVNNTSALQGREFVFWSRETLAQNIERFVSHFN